MFFGIIYCIFYVIGYYYIWKKVIIIVYNIIVGKLWIDQFGEIDIVNYKIGDKCNFKFVFYSYFFWDVVRKVIGEVIDLLGKVYFVFLGIWDEKMECFKVQLVIGENGGDV